MLGAAPLHPLRFDVGSLKEMNCFHPTPDYSDDFSSIRMSGMWYQSWQAGYEDILKKGYPKPKDSRTILAELHSPTTPDFLHGGSSTVPFIVSERALEVFRREGITGYELHPVEISKIATKGRRSRTASSGEPEDQIEKRKNLINEVQIPILSAVFITGRVPVDLDYPEGRSPSGCVSPFTFRSADSEIPDLFRPEHKGAPFSAWSFCSPRFKEVIIKHELTNISFVRFSEFMVDFRGRTTERPNK